MSELGSPNAKSKFLGKKVVVTVGKGPPTLKSKTILPVVSGDAEKDGVPDATNSGEASKVNFSPKKKPVSIPNKKSEQETSPKLVAKIQPKTPIITSEIGDTMKSEYSKVSIGQQKAIIVSAQPTTSTKDFTSLPKKSSSVSASDEQEAEPRKVETSKNKSDDLPIYSMHEKAYVVLPTGYGNGRMNYPNEIFMSFPNDPSNHMGLGHTDISYLAKLKGSDDYIKSMSAPFPQMPTINPITAPSFIDHSCDRDVQNRNMQFPVSWVPMIPLHGSPFGYNQFVAGNIPYQTKPFFPYHANAGDETLPDQSLQRHGELENEDSHSLNYLNKSSTISLVSPLQLPKSKEPLNENLKSSNIGTSPWEMIENQFNKIRSGIIKGSKNVETNSVSNEDDEKVIKHPTSENPYNARYQKDKFEWQNEDLSSYQRPLGEPKVGKKVKGKKFQKGWDRWGHKAGITAPRKREFHSITEISNYFTDLEPENQSDIISLLLACRKLEKKIDQQSIIVEMLEHDLREAQRVLRFPPEWRALQELDMQNGAPSNKPLPSIEAPLFLKGKAELIPDKDKITEAFGTDGSDLRRYSEPSYKSNDGKRVAEDKNKDHGAASSFKIMQKKVLSPISKAKYQFSKGKPL